MAQEENQHPKPRILIVEDEKITSAHLRRVLVRLGYEVVGMASGGAAALKEVEQTRPDLLIADVGLNGDMDGVALATCVLEKWQIPTVFLTAYNDPETHIRARLTDDYGFVVKPFAEQDLHATIETALQKKKLQTGCNVGRRLAAIQASLQAVLLDFPAAVRDQKIPEVEVLSRRVTELANELSGVSDRLRRK